MSRKFFSVEQRKLLVCVSLVFIISRGVVLGGVIFGEKKVPVNDVPYRWDLPQSRLAPLFRWDTGFYLDICKNGYSFDTSLKTKSNAIFFPLYPMIVRTIHKMTSIEIPLLGVLLSNLFFILSLYFLFKLVKEGIDHQIAFLTILYLSLFPTALFFSTMYTESLFLLLAILTFVFLRNKRWVQTGIVGFLAGLTRVNGITLTFPILYSVYSTWRENKKITPGAIWAFLSPVCGLGTFMVYLWLRFGEPVAFVTGLMPFKRQPVGFFPFVILKNVILSFNLMITKGASVVALNVWFVILFILCALYLFKKLPKEYFYFLVANLLVFSSTTVYLPGIEEGALYSTTRYLAVLFPGFIALGKIGNKFPKVNIVIIIIFSNLLLLYSALYSRWYWVG